MAFREAFWTLTFKNPALNSLLTVVPGIKARQQIVILGLIDLVGKTKTLGQCAPDPSTQQIPDIQKEWNPNQVEDRFIECWKDLLDKFYVWGLKNNIDKPNLTGTDFADFITERVIDGLVQSIYRIAWLGDTAAANLTTGVDVRYFNAIDGIWKQIFAIATAFPNHHEVIPNNAGVSYAAQKFTAADTDNQLITGIMQSMIDNADTRLVGNNADPASRPTFFVTRSVMNQLKAERRKFPYIAQAYTRQETGFGTMEFDGYDVVELDFLDRFIQAYFNNGTVTYRPHRIYFTNILNVQLGVEEEGTMTSVEDFYAPVEKQYYIDTLYTIDAKIIEDYKVSSAY
jgi:hypothetical protein